MDTHNISSLKQTLSTPAMLEKVRQWLLEQAGRTLLQFAYFLCVTLDLRNACGSYRDHTCARALEELHRDGTIDLQASLRWDPPREKRPHKPRCLPEPVPLPEGVPDSVEKIGKIWIVRVETDPELLTWNTALETEHDIGAAVPPGHALRLLFYSEHGLLACMCFSSAMDALALRDDWVDFTPEQRDALAKKIIIFNSRLLIRTKGCRNLASKVIAMGEDFARKVYKEEWDVDACLIETFVNPEKHGGACYKAAGYEPVGLTEGRGDNGETVRKDGETPVAPKMLFMKVLVPDFRKRFGIGRPRGEDLPPLWFLQGPLSISESLDGDLFMQEFAGSPLGDRRRNRRIARTAGLLYASPGSTVCGAARGGSSGGYAEMKGAYRIFESGQAFGMDAVMQGHSHRTCRRMMACERVYVALDRTLLDFSAKQQTCRDMGDVGRNQTGTTSRGVGIFSAWVSTEDGIPLGILRSDCEVRHFRKKGDPKPKDVPPEKRKSHIWIEFARWLNGIARWMPKTKLCILCDRESDFGAFLNEIQLLPSVEVVLRAKADRAVEGGSRRRHTLFRLMRATEECAKMTVRVPRISKQPKKRGQAARSAREARDAVLSVRMHRVTFRLPDGKTATLWAVTAVELDKPKGLERVWWNLLTTRDLKSPEDAVKCVEDYARRWGIEEFHRVFKHGCKVENLALRDLDHIERAIGVEEIVAWSFMLRHKLGREHPDLPPEAAFDDLEVAVLDVFSLKKKELKSTI
ncbi:MAG: IS4 family transposase [Desulfovibrio sp.]|nr:IS4 family transposase [Desulfovibrio sp.]